MGITRLIALAVILVTSISAWILGVRMRGRIKRTLGIDATSEAELTSLTTWMKVEDVEERNRGEKMS